MLQNLQLVLNVYVFIFGLVSSQAPRRFTWRLGDAHITVQMESTWQDSWLLMDTKSLVNILTSDLLEIYYIF